MSNDDETGGGDDQNGISMAMIMSETTTSSSSSSSSSSTSSSSSSSSNHFQLEIALDPARMALAEHVFDELINDLTFGLILQTHRAAKLGYLQFVDPDSDAELDKQFEIYDDSDVLGVFRANVNENSNKSSNKPQIGKKKNFFSNSNSLILRFFFDFSSYFNSLKNRKKN